MTTLFFTDSTGIRKSRVFSQNELDDYYSHIHDENCDCPPPPLINESLRTSGEKVKITDFDKPKITKLFSLNSLIKCGDMYLHKTVLKSVIACYIERSDTSEINGHRTINDNNEEGHTVTLECKNNVHYALITFNSKPEAQDWMSNFIENVYNQYA